MSYLLNASHKWFSWVHQNQLIYNSCWEDPRIDRKAMKLQSQDSVLVITSAGCNALDYALDGPSKIYAVDVNPRQNALLSLKKAGIEALEYEDFFEIFGKGSHRDFKTLYFDKLRRRLPSEAKAFWDSKYYYFLPRKNREGFYFRGSTGLFAWIMKYYMSALSIREEVLDLFEADSLEDQAKRYQKVVEKFWTKGVRSFMDSDLSMSLLGVPRAQRLYIEKTFSNSVALFAKHCVDSVFTQLSLRDNYFWWLYLSGSYTEERAPNYLQRNAFQKLKDGRVQLIETHTKSVEKFLRESPRRISKFVLLDHMDWLADHDIAALGQEWEAIFESATEQAQILFRSGGMDAQFLNTVRLRGPKGKPSQPLNRLLKFDDALAKRLHRTDRVHTYGSFYICRPDREQQQLRV